MIEIKLGAKPWKIPGRDLSPISFTENFPQLGGWGQDWPPELCSNCGGQLWSWEFWGWGCEVGPFFVPPHLSALTRIAALCSELGVELFFFFKGPMTHTVWKPLVRQTTSNQAFCCRELSYFRGPQVTHRPGVSPKPGNNRLWSNLRRLLYLQRALKCSGKKADQMCKVLYSQREKPSQLFIQRIKPVSKGCRSVWS